MEYLSINEIFLTPISSQLSVQENSLRHKILSSILDDNLHKQSFSQTEKNCLQTLAEKNILSLDKGGNIGCIYPLSTHKTNKKIYLSDGRTAYAMCALDAIGCHYAFRQPIRIESECQYSKKKIELIAQDGKISSTDREQDIHILHTDLANIKKWSCSCCNIMHFFQKRTYLEQWHKQQSINQKCFFVDLETANKIAWLLFSL